VINMNDNQYIAHCGIIIHYGVGADNNPPGRGSGRYPKGSGKRPFQHDSAKRRVRNAAKTKSYVDSIVNALSDDDKVRLGFQAGESEYLSEEEGKWVVKRFLLYEGDTPVAFFDVLSDGVSASVDIAVRSDKQGKGYGRKIAKKGSAWIDKNLDRFDHVEWNAKETNAASRKLAEDNGFHRFPDRDYEKPTGKFVSYVKSPKWR